MLHQAALQGDVGIVQRLLDEFNADVTLESLDRDSGRMVKPVDVANRTNPQVLNVLLIKESIHIGQVQLNERPADQSDSLHLLRVAGELYRLEQELALRREAGVAVWIDDAAGAAAPAAHRPQPAAVVAPAPAAPVAVAETIIPEDWNSCCVVCMDERADMVGQACGHASMCEPCSRQLTFCPIDRCPTTFRQRVRANGGAVYDAGIPRNVE